MNSAGDTDKCRPIHLFTPLPPSPGKHSLIFKTVHHKPCLTHIKITSIDISDQTYVFGPKEDVEPEPELIESINHYGILHPPVVTSIKDNTVIVSGRRRILAARRITALHELPCLVIPPDTPQLYIYTIFLEESLSGKQLSLIQQADFLKKMLHFSRVEDTLPLLTKLGFKPQKYILDQLLSLLSLSKDSLLAVHKGEIQQKTARKMVPMAAADQEVIVQLIHSLNLGGSKQQKLVEYCIELIMRTGQPLSSLLQPFIQVDGTDKKQNIPQQAASLLSWLHKQCYPRTQKAELEFRQFTAKLHLPTHLQVKHSPSFEDDQVVLSVTFKDKDSLQLSLPDIIRTTCNNKDNN